MEQSELPQRHSIRLPQHTYQWTASYFITLRSDHHEHIIRDTADLAQKREYIRLNPTRWQEQPDRYT